MEEQVKLRNDTTDRDRSYVKCYKSLSILETDLSNTFDWPRTEYSSHSRISDLKILNANMLGKSRRIRKILIDKIVCLEIMEPGQEECLTN